MGAIVLQEREGDTAFNEAKQILVVDGQQRLTTLQLLLKAIQQAFYASTGEDATADDLEPLLFNDHNRTGVDHLNETKIRQSNTLDQSEFQEIIRDLRDGHRPSRSIADAYNYFHTEIIGWLNRGPGDVQAKADALYKGVIEYLKVAAITLDSGEKPHFIFEILNTRGESLKEADHIKNTVMYEAGVIDDAQKARQLWGPFENDWWRREDGRGRDVHIVIDRFLNYWVIMRVGESITIRRTAAEFRSFVEDQKPDIEEVAKDIREAGRIYRNIEENCQPGIERFVERVKTMEIGVIMPPLLWLYTQEIPEDKRLRSVKALESYLVRRMLCNIRSQGLNRLFIELVKALKTHSDKPADVVVIDFLQGQSVENRIWPDDRRVADYLTTQAMPDTVARRKMVFEAIENHIRPRITEPLGATEKLTVEHLMPQGWNESEWPLPEGYTDRDEAGAYRNATINLIGNLTLASRELNSHLSNRSWENKRKALNSYASLFLNKTLLDDFSAWNEDAIVHRSERLAQVITEIWPHADGI